MIEKSGIEDQLAMALGMARKLPGSHVGIVGYGVVTLTGADGALKRSEPFANLITTVGDQYYAKKAIVGVSPANAAAPTNVTGMKLGTATTAAAKSGAGAAIVTYATGGNAVFSVGYPTATAHTGTNTGWDVTYRCDWGTGTVLTAITEVALVNDGSTNATTLEANTYARAVITSITKASTDTLAVTWVHTFLGA